MSVCCLKDPRDRQNVLEIGDVKYTLADVQANYTHKNG